VLLIEALGQAEIYASWLRSAGFAVTHVENRTEALEAMVREQPKLVILNPELPQMDGVDVLNRLRERDCLVEIVVITSNASLRGAVTAVRAGAFDYLVKPFKADRLIDTLQGALSSRKLRPKEWAGRPDADRDYAPNETFLGCSRTMQAVHRVVRTAAASRATVFITGESGTGKEMCAEAIYRASARRTKPFVAINCSAIPKDLAESELFGHVKGAFTGAVRERHGAAIRAHGGTLFLDEICETDINLQAKLLRFLQSGAVQRVGASEVENVDVRIICATNRDPVVEVAGGRFREDLYYRLHVIPIRIPPLRERDDDALEIARALLVEYAHEEDKRFRRLTPCAEAAIAAYDWPGNVRQLQNVLRNAVVLNDGEELTAGHLPEFVRSSGKPGLGMAASRATRAEDGTPGRQPAPTVASATARATLASFPLITPLSKLEQKAIEEAVRVCGNNIALAAAALGVSPSTIYRKLQAWNSVTHA
jgi:two-component system repressor protein LuxO